jgi:hypothetical protein
LQLNGDPGSIFTRRSTDPHRADRYPRGAAAFGGEHESGVGSPAIGGDYDLAGDFGTQPVQAAVPHLPSTSWDGDSRAATDPASGTAALGSRQQLVEIYGRITSISPTTSPRERNERDHRGRPSRAGPGFTTPVDVHVRGSNG